MFFNSPYFRYRQSPYSHPCFYTVLCPCLAAWLSPTSCLVCFSSWSVSGINWSTFFFLKLIYFFFFFFLICWQHNKYRDSGPGTDWQKTRSPKQWLLLSLTKRSQQGAVVTSSPVQPKHKAHKPGPAKFLPNFTIWSLSRGKKISSIV